MEKTAHDHGHDHDHAHDPELLPNDSALDNPHETFNPKEAKQARRLGFVLGLISIFFVVELVGAIYARSNVLKADALHLLMDVLALGMSLIAMRIAVRRPTARFTFGLRRTEPVAAIVNGLLVLLATLLRRA